MLQIASIYAAVGHLHAGALERDVRGINRLRALYDVARALHI
jgi:hypothetical protein